MKNLKIILAIALQILLINFLYAQSMVNNGAKIVNQSGSSLIIAGNYVNQLDGNIVNYGNIAITGNWTNNATSGSLMLGSYGEVKFNGPAIQNIGGTAQTHFSGLLIESEVDVNTVASVQHDLVLLSYKIRANNADLKMEYGSTITGSNPLAYVETAGSGRLIMAVDNLDQTFPVGTSASYCPVTLNNSFTGGLDFFYVNVFPDVLEGGTIGTTIGEIDNCVNLTWNIDEMVPGALDLSVTTQWNASDEGIGFDRTKCGIGHYITGSGWIPQEESTSNGANPYDLTRSGITDLSAFAVGDIYSPMASTLHLTLDITAFLEGPYNGVNMYTVLNVDNLLPKNQPFNTSPWNYAGSESVPSIPNVDVVDWILVELRDASTPTLAIPSTIMEQQAAFLLKDGSIVGLDGSSDLSVTNSPIDNLFVVIWHRNHLGVMTADPVVEIGGIYTYNFTAGANMAHGGITGHKELGSGTGIYGMVGGDGDADGEVNLLDKTNIWMLQAGQEGYISGDFNMDGQVNNPDKNDILIENQTKQSQIPD